MMDRNELVKLGGMVNAAIASRIEADPSLVEKIPHKALGAGMVHCHLTDTEKRQRLEVLQNALGHDPASVKRRELRAVPEALSARSIVTTIPSGAASSAFPSLTTLCAYAGY